MDARARGGDEHGEADHADYGGEDVAEAALAGAVGDVADCYGEDGGGGVWGDGEELGLGGFVT